jgi:uncharacterized OsmC-like protein
MAIGTERLNDVNLDAVGALVENIQQRPEAANTIWKAEVRWTGAFRSEVRIREFPAIASDEPAGLGGGDTAPNPVEQLLGALGNCLAVGYAANASAAGIALDDVRIELEGDLDLRTFLGLTQGNAGYEGVRVKVHVDADATDEQLRHLHEKVVGTSPVGHTVSRPVALSIELA